MVTLFGKGLRGRGWDLRRFVMMVLMAGWPLLVPAQVQSLPPLTGELNAWQEIVLNDQVLPNVFVARHWDGRQAVEIQSANSMSLLATVVTVDLLKTPYLCWWWRVDGALKTADMQTRAGDDYAARLYISVQLPPDQISFGHRLQLGLARAIWGEHVPDGAVNYVWDNAYPIGHEQANAYTNLARMVVLQTGDTQAGRWVPQHRNVKADIERLFGSGAQVVQMAVTSDTDNTGESARAGFADLMFADDPKRCDVK